MPTITIPKEIVKKSDLVAIPKKEYETFIYWKKNIKIRLEDEWFWMPEWQKKEAEADIAIKDGRVFGPFSNHKFLITALKKKKK